MSSARHVLLAIPFRGMATNVSARIRPSMSNVTGKTTRPLRSPTLPSRRWATTDSGPDHPMPPGMDKILSSPKAVASIEKLMTLLEKKGVDVKSGKPPSMMQMASIAMASEVRDATREGACDQHSHREKTHFFFALVMEALREVGVDVSPEKLSQIMNGKGHFLDGLNEKKGDSQ